MFLTVNAEIVGIAGISGNGQAELLAALSGRAPSGKTTVWLDGEGLAICTPAADAARGLAFVPEERLGRAWCRRNRWRITPCSPATRHGGMRRFAWSAMRARQFVQDCIARFDVRCGAGGGAFRVRRQFAKFIVGREIMLSRKAMIVAQPTWGWTSAQRRFAQTLLVVPLGRGDSGDFQVGRIV